MVNTAAIKKYDELKHSGDETDARYPSPSATPGHPSYRRQPAGEAP
jgi:hypothetical protein